jgi:dTDP-4-dehydrorhamnose 3,5-epimerase
VGIIDDFVQENHSHSIKGVLRGLHFQIKRSQAKLVTIIRGTIFDVGIDLRTGSPTFGQWFGTILSDESPSQVYMAPGFAHGFCVLSEVADVHYKVSRIYDPSDEGGVLWNDLDIGIKWPLDNPNMSDRDRNYPRLGNILPENLPQIQFAD